MRAMRRIGRHIDKERLRTVCILFHIVHSGVVENRRVVTLNKLALSVVPIMIVHAVVRKIVVRRTRPAIARTQPLVKPSVLLQRRGTQITGEIKRE